MVFYFRASWQFEIKSDTSNFMPKNGGETFQVDVISAMFIFSEAEAVRCFYI